MTLGARDASITSESVCESSFPEYGRGSKSDAAMASTTMSIGRSRKVFSRVEA